MGKDYAFEPNGLTGWKVFLQVDRFGSRWVFLPPEDFPHSFSWCDKAQDHVTPTYVNWCGPYTGPECKTARSAVAAAHRFKASIDGHLARIAALESVA